MRTLAYFLTPIKVILADEGYRREVIEQVKNCFGYLINVMMKSDEKKTGFQPISRRCIIEHPFSWFDNDRRL
ncbi:MULTISPECIES: hypothetical protein [Chryseobacterium]|uniref:Transposase n=1 Tax=Chryseobacterium salivictor TaxID=2547600 RepID=A0A4P6ZGT8_9FLAO|nr:MULTISPECIES: hypothetical protein [Chryseobacterium]MDQ0475553.1 hypothetical protein [Chryseobacterium sp. MDT2-18]QBO58976.1 hypothetical protein NBC122_02169 [Chryseobacterium salivictor]